MPKNCLVTSPLDLTHLGGPLGVPDTCPAIDWWLALFRFEGVGALLGTW